MVTIKDLAKIAKVSPTTVSNVLHGRTGKVSEQTLKKVQKAIEEMNYVSNMGGRLLAKHGSKIIGVIMTYARRDESNATAYPFYSEIIGALEEKIRESDFYMMLYTSGSIEESLKLSNAWDIEGLIVLGNTPEEAEKFFKITSVPIIFIDTYGKNIPNVGINDDDAMEELVSYLIDLGHRNLAFVTDSNILIGVDAERYKGFRRALVNKGIPEAEDDLIRIDFRESVRKAMLKELCRNDFKGYTALCFSSDYYATHAISYLSELNINIPEDISITGFDNNLLAKLSNPRLTTVHQNVSEKGYAAAEELVKMIKKGTKDAPQIKLETQLIVGGTTKFRF